MSVGDAGDEKESLYSMLISWYMCGYYTGFYEARISSVSYNLLYSLLVYSSLSCCRVGIWRLVIRYWCSVQGAYRSWKVMEFKIQIFQAWKVMENKPNGCHISDPCTCFAKFWIVMENHFHVLYAPCLCSSPCLLFTQSSGFIFWITQTTCNITDLQLCAKKCCSLPLTAAVDVSFEICKEALTYTWILR